MPSSKLSWRARCGSACRGVNLGLGIRCRCSESERLTLERSFKFQIFGSGRVASQQGDVKIQSIKLYEHE
eukprot:scaffold54107_cov30-Tisochrysis_lutea.AAC.3